MKLPVPIAFDGDKGNLDKNWEKHKVCSREAEEIFFNQPLKIYKDITHSQKEERFIALGITNKNRALHVAFTIRHGEIRLISFRNQSRKERKLYEEENS